MTEAEWLACTDPTKMLDFIRDRARERKLQLYLCGGCQHLAHLFFDAVSVVAIEVGERFADGQADETEFGRAAWAAEAPPHLATTSRSGSGIAGLPTRRKVSPG